MYAEPGFALSHRHVLLLAKGLDNAIQYLRRYMAEVPEKEREARDEKGNLKKDTKTYYQNAEDYIKKIEEERFFEGKK